MVASLTINGLQQAATGAVRQAARSLPILKNKKEKIHLKAWTVWCTLFVFLEVVSNMQVLLLDWAAAIKLVSAVSI